jgi:hypothetical protein
MQFCNIHGTQTAHIRLQPHSGAVESKTAVTPVVHSKIFSDIQHILGMSNAVADLLSRLILPTISDRPVGEVRSDEAVAMPEGVKVPTGSPPAATAAGTSSLAAIAKVCPGMLASEAVDYAAIAVAQCT